jgi:hypothetical protein
MLQRFEDFGYSRARGYYKFSRSDVWFTYAGSPSQVTHVAYLEYKPTWRAYAFKLGAFTPDSHRLAVAAIPTLAKYLHPSAATGSWHLERRPCWTFIDAGQMLGWTFVCLPDPSKREGWEEHLLELQENLLRPIFWCLSDAEQLAQLWLQKVHKLDWVAGNSVLRAAEIAALSIVAGTSASMVIDKLEPYHGLIARDMFLDKNVPRFLEELFQSLQAVFNTRG